MSLVSYKHPKQMLIEVSKSEKIGKYRPQKIIQKTTQQILLKIQKIMRQFRQLNVAQFLRLFMFVLRKQIGSGEQFYMLYGLFKVFKQICRSYKSTKITFSQLSSFITEKMPATDQQVIVKQKLLPIGFDIPQQQRMKMVLPSISGKVLTERIFLNPIPALFDKYQHVNRCISQALYSLSNEIYFSVDLPSNFIRVSDKKFNQIVTIESQLQISKKQSTIIYIAWSETQERIGAILGNYSLSFWSTDDNYRFQVNIPLPTQNLSNPFVLLGYMESMREWYVIDNRPVVFGLNSKNFQPEYQIKNFKMVKERSMQKILTLQMKYQKLLCVAFQRKIFLLSLQKRQVITQLVNFKTSITSIIFSQTFQTLFVSNFEIYFKAYELTEHCDLTQKGRLQGHKHQITLLGTVEKKPIVYSLQETGVMKLWDIRDFTCFQTFNVLKNVRYLQMFTVKEGICLVGSKLYLYKWAVEKKDKYLSQLQSDQNKEVVNPLRQKIILITSLNKNILVVTSQSLKLYSHIKGNLLKAIRGLYKATEISFAFLNTAKKQLYISNHQGYFLVLETEQFTKIYQFKFLPHPVSMFYSERQDLVTMAAQRQIHIMQWKRQEEFDLKRRIFNQDQNLIMCKVYSIHDLIAAVYEYQSKEQQFQKNKKTQKVKNNKIFFYTFERGKAIGFISVQNLVCFQIHKSKNILIVLETDRLKIYSFKKSISSLIFTLHHQIKLWSEEIFISSLTSEFTQHVSNLKQNVYSKGLLLFENSIILISNFSCLFCSIEFDYEKIYVGSTQRSDTNYNPYRISVESHVEAFAQIDKQSQIIDKLDEGQHILIKYKQTKAFAKTIYFLQLGNLMGIYNDKMDLHFFDHITHILVGVINTQLTLPKMWNFSFYEEAELQDIDFVLDYMENQEKKKMSQNFTQNSQSQIFSLTLNDSYKTDSPQKRKPSPLTIQKILQNMEKISPEKLTLIQQTNNYSLRQRKLMLEKQRQQKRRLQNFLQHQEQQELNKLRSYHSHDTQSNINEVLNFFAVNRNQVVKYKGIRQTQIPQQVKLLQKKLQSSLKSFQRKPSILQTTGTKNTSLIRLSEIRGQRSNTKMRNTQRKQILPLRMSGQGRIMQKIGSMKLLSQSLQNVSNQSPYKKLRRGNVSEKKILLKVLDDEVRRSKLSTKLTFAGQRNSSLPVLKKFNN